MIAAKEEPDHRKELNEPNLTDDEVFVSLCQTLMKQPVAGCAHERIIAE